MPTDYSDLTKYSGESMHEKAPSLRADQIRLDGKKGKFYLVELTKPMVLNEKKGRKEYNKIELPDKVEMTFLRVRRQLVEKPQDKPKEGDPKMMSSIEHNTKDDRILMYKDNGVEVGSSEYFQDKYKLPNGKFRFRTHQVVYVMYSNRLCKLLVRGSSLGSQAKAENVLSFYQYITSFGKNEAATDGVKDHLFEFKTMLSIVEEENDLGEYYSMTFNRGAKNDETEMKNVAHLLKGVYNFFEEYDTFFKKKMDTIAPVLAARPVSKVDEQFEKIAGTGDPNVPTISYPTEDDEGVSLEDIPF